MPRDPLVFLEYCTWIHAYIYLDKLHYEQILYLCYIARLYNLKICVERNNFVNRFKGTMTNWPIEKQTQNTQKKTGQNRHSDWTFLFVLSFLLFILEIFKWMFPRNVKMCYSTSNKFIQWASIICTTWPSNIFPYWIQKCPYFFRIGRLGASALYHCFSTIKAVDRKKYPNEKTQRQVREM